jgi:hypothetical protein
MLYRGTADKPLSLSFCCSHFGHKSSCFIYFLPLIRFFR